MYTFVLFLVYVAISRSNAKDDIGYFWHITDIHYDWTYFKGHLACSRNVSSLGKYGNYLCDSPWTLVNDSVAAMRKIKADPDFMIWTGDNTPHIPDDKLTVDDIIFVMENITDLLMDVFPSTPVYSTFGNNDVYPHNQVPVKYYSPLLFQRMADKWEPWIEDFEPLDSLKRAGYYTVKTSHGLRIVSLNTNLYIGGNKVTAGVDDPLDQFKWLEDVLRQAEANQEKKFNGRDLEDILNLTRSGTEQNIPLAMDWTGDHASDGAVAFDSNPITTSNCEVMIIGHTCPGVLAPRNVVRLHTQHNERLVELCRNHADVIVAMHCGHAHEDIFKLLTDKDGNPLATFFIAPSVTPHRYSRPTTLGPAHNPGIRLIKYNRSTNVQLDMTQYYINLPDSNANRRTDWKAEYAMQPTYDIPDLSPKSIHAVVQKLTKYDNGQIMGYFKRMTSSTNPEIRNSCDDTCKHSIGCGFTNFELESFNDCLNGDLSRNSAGVRSPSLHMFWPLLVNVGVNFLIFYQS